MLFSLAPPTLFSLLAVVLSSLHTTDAKPYPRDELVIGLQNSTLVQRQCAQPCGWEQQLCCTSDQSCYTDSAGQAECGSATVAQAISTATATAEANIVGGEWQYYTTTFVQTDLVTVVSTYSSYIAPTTTQQVTTITTEEAPATTSATCDYSLNESPCGTICCAAGQMCQYQGQCVVVGASTSDISSYYYSSVFTSSASASAFIRPTSNTVQTVTSTGSATTTVPFQTPVGTSGSTMGVSASTSSGGLSAGAIAGIVIGVIAGIILLLLLCFCCCSAALIDAFMSLFGLGKRRRTIREETIIRERHSHQGGGGGGDAGGGGGRTWFGTRPAGVDRPPPKKSGGLGGFTTVAAGLTALALLLGLKRRRDRAKERSSYGSESSYSYSDYTSASK
ncbi:hypothetical protein MMC12_000338 [Toensbergia leucococca]|nr:hypothetical protein [Toensbergia leucococca]